MKKENKKLESRQDVLSRWVSKDGMIDGQVIESVSPVKDEYLVIFKDSLDFKNYRIYEILYSPKSNFFEVMFPLTFTQELLKVPVYYNVIRMKEKCVTSRDPLQYLLDNLNETTS